jgi:hypothetical protein
MRDFEVKTAGLEISGEAEVMEVTKATCDALSHLEDGINGFDGSISQAGFEATSQRDVQALRTFSASLAELPIVWARRVNPYALSSFIPVQNFILGQRRERSWERCWKDFGMAPPIDLRNDSPYFFPESKKLSCRSSIRSFLGDAPDGLRAAAAPSSPEVPIVSSLDSSVDATPFLFRLWRGVLAAAGDSTTLASACVAGNPTAPLWRFAISPSALLSPFWILWPCSKSPSNLKDNFSILISNFIF